jgi:hypothetical protein
MSKGDLLLNKSFEEHLISLMYLFCCCHFQHFLQHHSFHSFTSWWVYLSWFLNVPISISYTDFVTFVISWKFTEWTHKNEIYLYILSFLIFKFDFSIIFSYIYDWKVVHTPFQLIFRKNGEGRRLLLNKMTLMQIFIFR